MSGVNRIPGGLLVDYASAVRFAFEGQAYEFKRMPFGLSTAPRLCEADSARGMGFAFEFEFGTPPVFRAGSVRTIVLPVSCVLMYLRPCYVQSVFRLFH